MIERYASVQMSEATRTGLLRAAQHERAEWAKCCQIPSLHQPILEALLVSIREADKLIDWLNAIDFSPMAEKVGRIQDNVRALTDEDAIRLRARIMASVEDVEQLPVVVEPGCDPVDVQALKEDMASPPVAADPPVPADYDWRHNSADALLEPRGNRYPKPKKG